VGTVARKCEKMLMKNVKAEKVEKVEKRLSSKKE
jgi:hypothetical protein